jgi:hypothetical protein
LRETRERLSHQRFPIAERRVGGQASERRSNGVFHRAVRQPLVEVGRELAGSFLRAGAAIECGDGGG